MTPLETALKEKLEHRYVECPECETMIDYINENSRLKPTLDILVECVRALEYIRARSWAHAAKDKDKWINEFCDVADKTLAKLREHLKLEEV